MGAVIGSESFKLEYVRNKVSKWVRDVEVLSEIAEDEPQAVYSCFTKAISHRWTYVQRTIPNIAALFEPLESAIRHKLLPALTGRSLSDMERKIFALPVKLGGMGIHNPTVTADNEYTASARITANLTDVICNQESDLTNYDKEGVAAIIKEVKTLKDQDHRDSLQEILDNADHKLKRILELAQEKGAGSWLTARPTKSHGFALNK